MRVLLLQVGRVCRGGKKRGGGGGGGEGNDLYINRQHVTAAALKH